MPRIVAAAIPQSNVFRMEGKAMKAALYLRVSTAEQTTANQEAELLLACARHDWEVVKVFHDAGISGAKGRDKRPAFDALCKAIARREFDLVAAWSVDRLGRSLIDLIGFLQDIHSAGVGLYLHQQGLDTTTSSGRAMFGMLSVFAEYERAILRERTVAGLRRAQSAGKRLGRPKVAPAIEAAVRASLAAGNGIQRTARSVGVGVSTVMRIKAGG
jgi:DNA invertase Pin-like site-specific DNA recombinase